jgi:hypothetical protein
VGPRPETTLQAQNEFFIDKLRHIHQLNKAILPGRTGLWPRLVWAAARVDSLTGK